MQNNSNITNTFLYVIFKCYKQTTFPKIKGKINEPNQVKEKFIVAEKLLSGNCVVV